jgi:GAF domain-containing protein
LRRIATLVARGAPQEEVFAAVVEEIVQLLGVSLAIMGRYESDATLTAVARSGGPRDHLPVGSRRTLGGNNLGTIVFQTGRPARAGRYADHASGPIGLDAREAGIRSSVAAPITVEGRIWGVIAAGWTLDRALPADTEARLAAFTELSATAVANAESRAGLARLAEEQAALQRVATLVARGMRQDELFAVVTEEIGRLLPAEYAYLGRYESDRALVIVGAWDEGAREYLAVGSRRAVGGNNLVTIVFETGRSARMNNYGDASGPLGIDARERGVRSGVGTPVMVEGRLWGSLSPVRVVSSRCRWMLRRVWVRSRIWSRRRSRMPRAGVGSPGWPRCRRRCGASRRWWPGVGRPRRCLQRLSTRSCSCFRSITPVWPATSPMVWSHPSPPGARPTFPLGAA